MTKYEAIKEKIENLDIMELVILHNNYCEAAGCGDDYIYLMDELDDVMAGVTPWEITRAVVYGDFRPCDSFFWFNGYGNLESSDSPERKIIFAEDIADYIDCNDDALENEEIQDLLDEYNAIEERFSEEEKSDKI